MSDYDKRIGESIIMLKTEGFRGGFLNPFSHKVIVESQDKMTQKEPYRATFILKDPEDARAFLEQVGKHASLRIWLVGEERAVVKAMETLGKSKDLGKKDLDTAKKIAQMREFSGSKAVRKAASDMGVKGILEERVKEVSSYRRKLEMAGKEI